MKNLDAYLKEVSDRLERATPGPWKTNMSLYTDARIWIESVDCPLYIGAKDKALFGTLRDNCNFIAHSRQDIDKLLKVVRVLREACEFYSDYPSYDFRKKIQTLGLDYEDGSTARHALSKAEQILGGQDAVEED